MPYLMEVCKEDGLGKIGISFSLCLIMCCIVDYSSYLNGTKEVVIKRNDVHYLYRRISDIFSYKILIFITLCGLFVAIVLSFSSIIEKQLLLLSLPIVLSQLVNPNWLLQGLEKFKLIAYLNIVSKFIYIVCIFSFIRKADDYIWANFFFGFSGVIVYTTYLIFLFKKYKLPIKRENFVNGVKILKSDFNICISELCLSIYQYFPILIVGYFTGNSMAGLYRVLEQIFSVFRTFIFMFFNFSYPTVCYDTEKSLSKGLSVWKTYHLANFLMIAIGVFMAFIFKDFILDFFHVVAADKIRLIGVFKYAMVVPLLLVISQALRQLMFALNLSTTYTKIIYLMCSMSVVLLGFFVYFYGLVGSFVSMIMTETIVIILYLTFILKKIKTR